MFFGESRASSRSSAGLFSECVVRLVRGMQRLAATELRFGGVHFSQSVALFRKHENRRVFSATERLPKRELAAASPRGSRESSNISTALNLKHGGVCSGNGFSL